VVFRVAFVCRFLKRGGRLRGLPFSRTSVAAAKRDLEKMGCKWLWGLEKKILGFCERWWESCAGRNRGLEGAVAPDRWQAPVLSDDLQIGWRLAGHAKAATGNEFPPCEGALF
jgi:hypothetical protein